MEDEASILLDGKALGNLRVVDLKQELEKRGLSKSGSKKDLVKRLKQQLEFEKLCGERKSTGDCDKLKLELDADTEQNEFVQQYLAQQQKIYAEQKEVKRLIELEEIQRSSDERGSDSPKADDTSDQETHPEESSDDESQTEEKEPVTSEARPQGQRRIARGSSKERTETVLTPVPDKDTHKEEELNVGIHDKKVKENSLNVEVSKNQETEHEVTIRRKKDEVSSVDVEPTKKQKTKHDTTVRRKECEVASVNDAEGSIGKEGKVVEREISPVFIEEETINKESRSEVIHKEDTSSLANDDQNQIQTSKEKTISKGTRSEVVQKEDTNSLTDDDKNQIQASKDKIIKDEVTICVVDEKENRNEEVRVENTQDISNVSSVVEDAKDENLDVSVRVIENKNIETSGLENFEGENVNLSRDENISGEDMTTSKIEKVEHENMEISETENIEVESMEVSEVESTKISRVENVKTSRVENIESENVEVSTVETVQKIETVIKTVDKEDDENQKSVSSSSSSSVDHAVKIQKLSERKSVEETSNTLKNHPSSLDSCKA